MSRFRNVVYWLLTEDFFCLTGRGFIDTSLVRSHDRRQEHSLNVLHHASRYGYKGDTEKLTEVTAFLFRFTLRDTLSLLRKSLKTWDRFPFALLLSWNCAKRRQVLAQLLRASFLTCLRMMRRDLFCTVRRRKTSCSSSPYTKWAKKNMKQIPLNPSIF